VVLWTMEQLGVFFIKRVWCGARANGRHIERDLSCFFGSNHATREIENDELRPGEKSHRAFSLRAS
jgi:hypothetical protein